MENDCGRAARPYFADPTANTAIGNVMREEREEKRKKEMEKRKLLLKDISSVLKEAKAKGRLSNLSEKVDGGNALKGTCGIGHTRWATHGEPSIKNAHPHVSGNCTGSGSGEVESEVVGVHNGIIENYQELRDKLSRHGYKFYSDRTAQIGSGVTFNHKGLGVVIHPNSQIEDNVYIEHHVCLSFIVLGNYSLGLQTSGAVDFIAQYAADGDLYALILNIINTMPASKFILIVTMLCMIAFYATSFDSIAYTAACYSYKKLGENEHPHKLVELLWCILLIVLPIALVFSESSMNNIQSVSIISAFPIGIIMIIMIWGFLKDIKKYLEEKK